MSSILRAPSVGPIVGHTTATSSRIWIRGNETDESRTVGVAALYCGGVYVPGSAQYFRLRREFDRTGIVDFGALLPDTSYSVKAGSLSLDTADPYQVDKDADVFSLLPPVEGWLSQLSVLNPNDAVASFTTFAHGINDTLSFVFGSCRYPGVLWMKKRADVIFKCVH